MLPFPRLLLFLSLSACSQQAPPVAATPGTGAAPAEPGRVAALPPAEAGRQLAQPGVVVLDVRTPVEYALGHLPNARNLNFRDDDFAQQVAQLDRSKPYVLYCASGNRSGQAASIMQQQGFRQVVNGGSYQDLKSSSQPPTK